MTTFEALLYLEARRILAYLSKNKFPSYFIKYICLPENFGEIIANLFKYFLHNLPILNVDDSIDW